VSQKIKNDAVLQQMLDSGWFRVRRDGRIETCYQWRACKEFIVPWFVCDRADGKGYRYVSFRGHRVKAHRLAYALYHRRVPVGQEINHDDGNRLNNRKRNLEACDACRQSEHAYQIGLNPWRKLTEAQVLEIRARAARHEPYTEIAKDYPVHHVNVRAIVLRKTWRWLP